MFSKDKEKEKRSELEAPRPLKVATRISPPSIISANLRILGNLVSDGDIQIDGTVDGDVNSRSLTISQGSTVNGGVMAETVRVDGAVNGQIKATNIILGPTAHVVGDVVHASLVVEAGAFVEGHVRRMEAEPAPIIVPVATVIRQTPIEDQPLYGTA